MTSLRIGNGYDVHKLVENRDLILGGVKIDYKLGLLGHSDADVLIHAVIDSLLSPANLGDIGKLFPDSDLKYKDIDSLKLLSITYDKLVESNFKIVNIDVTVICELPKISPHTRKMRENISKTLGFLDLDCINIKGTTTEKLGFTGRGEGIAVIANALIMKN